MEVLNTIYLILLIIETIGGLIYAIVKSVKNGNVKQLVQWITDLTPIVKKSIQEAEDKYNSGEGIDKMTHVLMKVRKACSDLEIDYLKIEEPVKELVDKIIADYNLLEKRNAGK